MPAQNIQLQFIPVQGNSVGEASLLVVPHGLSVPPTLYADSGLLTPVANPVALDSTGNVDFWVSDDSLIYDGFLSGGMVVGQPQYTNLAALSSPQTATIYQPKYFTIDLVPTPSGTVGTYSANVVYAATGLSAPLYTDATLTTPLTNPIVSFDTNIAFWVADRTVDYNIVLSGANLLAQQTIEDIWSLPAPIWANRAVYWTDAVEEWAYVNPYNVVVTSTSNVAAWTPNFQDIIEEACERAGFEIRTGYQFRTARRSLNILFQEWANRGLNLWTVTSAEIPLIQGQVTYDLPADCVDIIEHTIRQNQGSQYNQTDIIIPRIALPTYAAIPNKLAQGRPVQVYVNRQAPRPQINIWPTANTSGYIFRYWYLRRIQDASQPGFQTVDMPFRFVPAIIAGLAYHMAVKTPESMDRIPMLKQMYEEAYQLAADEDRDRAPVRFVPLMGYTGRGSW